jgi:hypothetical protein
VPAQSFVTLARYVWISPGACGISCCRSGFSLGGSAFRARQNALPCGASAVSTGASSFHHGATSVTDSATSVTADATALLADGGRFSCGARSLTRGASRELRSGSRISGSGTCLSRRARSFRGSRSRLASLRGQLFPHGDRLLAGAFEISLYSDRNTLTGSAAAARRAASQVANSATTASAEHAHGEGEILPDGVEHVLASEREWLSQGGYLESRNASVSAEKRPRMPGWVL